jgi:hypothetical protein
MAAASRLPETDIAVSAATASVACRRTPASRSGLRPWSVARPSPSSSGGRLGARISAPKRSGLKVAQLRYAHGAWTLHWADRNGRWRRYLDLEPSPRVDDLLVELDRDPAGAFWG